MTEAHSLQAPANVVMVRPHCFTPNPQTAADNSFQSTVSPLEHTTIAKAAYQEVSAMAKRLEAAGIGVHLFENGDAKRPDSVFPNNWFSTHVDGRIAIFPMYWPNRRTERQQHIIDMLAQTYQVTSIHDYSSFERQNLFLEGTGSMVFDHKNRVAYAAKSKRTDEELLKRFCQDFDFTPFLFDALDSNGKLIYHTNVMMCIGTKFCAVGLACIQNTSRRKQLHEKLKNTGRVIVELSQEQINDYAGNMLELSSDQGPVIVLSERAFKILTRDQVKDLERAANLLTVDIPTLELAGGSARCMMAGIHLARL